ncbi:MAG: TerB family tellurite resistance protein [Cyanobium sp. MAG_137]|jgi:uncharacterized tellurite resistance protein B-like protein|uniref:tellurite resistance TerB family protein n=1 Tax=Cyanobium usitatum TaxID=2304190 RepID=UPI0007137548|nr:hypothetical protein [Cyanobium usitatum]KRO94439.1 MAG: hypothetical protein ABR96_10750 [cyanobacterium BACL30 MAG-120619-bin27]MDP4736997.1 TerB family tellurite resistance protein [Cyanobium sp. MAG_216]MDP4881941.1 TerB family tellurite resistance protein [Cyanobium sp. MAG_137]CAK6691173.1 hypothetical protein OGCDGJMD_00980 [Cyanobium usitatum str. Tous]
MTLETGPSSSEISSSESGLSQRDRQLDLLRVVCCVAWADGDVSADEKGLLEKLVAKYFTSGDGSGANQEAARQLAAWTVDSSVLAEVIPRLTSGEDRALALKLSYMMAKVGQRPQDSSPINPAEKALYRQLVEALGLSESEVTETEWAAEQELSSGKGVWAALGAAFAGLGAWPSQEMLETPGMQWL